MNSFIAHSKLTLEPGLPKVLVVSNANFIRCLYSAGRRFLLSVEGQTSVPCWGGWKWTLKDQETAIRLYLKLEDGDPEPLEVEFVHGQGEFDDKQLQLVHSYNMASEIRMAVPNRSDSFYVTIHDGDTQHGVPLFDADDSVQEVVMLLPKVLPASMEADIGKSILVWPYFKDGSGSLFEMGEYRVKLVSPGSEIPEDNHEIRLKYNGAIVMNYQNDTYTFAEFYGYRLKLSNGES